MILAKFCFTKSFSTHPVIARSLPPWLGDDEAIPSVRIARSQSLVRQRRISLDFATLKGSRYESLRSNGLINL